MGLLDLEKQNEPAGNFEIKRATLADMQTVWKIIKKDSNWLAEQDLNHWAKYYTEEMIGKMITRKEVYLGLRDNEPISTITLDSKAPKYYAGAEYSKRFTNPDDPAIYVTAAAVLPNEHKKGFASRLLQFVERRARQKGAKWMRLDCRAEVPGLAAFYEKRGFQKLGSSPIDEGEDGTYWLMERKL